MTTEDFIAFAQIVRSMRQAQTAYFQSRTEVNLIAAKRLEITVDRALAEFAQLRLTGLDRENSPWGT